MPIVHCERCGAAVAARSGSYDYCVRCGLYVCTACWNDAGASCVTCAANIGRRTFVRDVLLMRRVDRRLRELTREALSVHREIASQSKPLEALRTDYACLRLKAASAERARDFIVAHKRRPQHRAKLAAMAARVDRRALGAAFVVAHVGTALELREAHVPMDAEFGAAAGRSRRPARWLPALAGLGALLTLAAVMVMASQDESRREGTLSGVPAVTRSDRSLSPPPAAAASSPASIVPPATLAVDFDDQRIGASAGWEQPADTDLVGVAAFPTSFDRSLRVATDDGAPVSSCLRVVPPVRLGMAEVDVVPDGADVTAGFSLRSSGMSLIVRTALTGTTTRLTGTDGSTATITGNTAGGWHRVSVSSATDGLDLVAGPVDQRYEQRPAAHLESGPAGDVGRVCFEVSGPPGSVAHFDNLTIGNESTAGGTNR